MVAEDAIKPPQAGRIGGVAQIGEQVEAIIARLLQQFSESGKIATSDVKSVNIGGPDRGIEQFRHRVPRRKGERIDHGLRQRIGQRPQAVGGPAGPHGNGDESDSQQPARAHPENTRHFHRSPPRQAWAAAPSRRCHAAIWSATRAGAVEPKLTIRSTALDAPSALRRAVFQPA